MTSLRAFFVMVGLMFLSFPAAAEVCEESAQKTLPVFSESEKQARNKYLKETKAFMEKLEVPSGLKVAVVVVGCLPDNSLTVSILKVVLVLNKDGTESSDKSEPLMSFDYQVIIYVTPPVFKNDVTAVTWLAAHEICHVKQER